MRLKPSVALPRIEPLEDCAKGKFAPSLVPARRGDLRSSQARQPQPAALQASVARLHSQTRCAQSGGTAAWCGTSARRDSTAPQPHEVWGARARESEPRCALGTYSAHGLRGRNGALHEHPAKDATCTMLPAYRRANVKATSPEGGARRVTIARADAQPLGCSSAGSSVARWKGCAARGVQRGARQPIALQATEARQLLAHSYAAPLAPPARCGRHKPRPHLARCGAWWGCNGFASAAQVVRTRWRASSGTPWTVHAGTHKAVGSATLPPCAIHDTGPPTGPARGHSHLRSAGPFAVALRDNSLRCRRTS